MTLNTEAVWAELYTNIRGFVGRRVSQPADADDIVQQVFLQVHKGLPNLRDADRLHAWIYQVTRRAITDHYRAPAHAREIPVGDAVDVVPEAQLQDLATGDQGHTALQELAACLQPLVASLATIDREALRLVEFEGLTQIEAAARLGLSASGMKSRVQRARSRLRSALDRCCRIALDRRGGVIDYEGRQDPDCCP